uniref:Uncharacterized protein n=1 Tax=Oryza rufipogon TaxID=4529 RepID=A0A0E0RD57_ORYRU
MNQAAPPLSSIEKWLFDEAAAEQVADLMDLSDGCCSVPMMCGRVIVTDSCDAVDRKRKHPTYRQIDRSIDNQIN